MVVKLLSPPPPPPPSCSFICSHLFHRFKKKNLTIVVSASSSAEPISVNTVSDDNVTVPQTFFFDIPSEVVGVSDANQYLNLLIKKEEEINNRNKPQNGKQAEEEDGLMVY